jgi:hypothetical protein
MKYMEDYPARLVTQQPQKKKTTQGEFFAHPRSPLSLLSPSGTNFIYSRTSTTDYQQGLEAA